MKIPTPQMFGVESTFFNLTSIQLAHVLAYLAAKFQANRPTSNGKKRVRVQWTRKKLTIINNEEIRTSKRFTPLRSSGPICLKFVRKIGRHVGYDEFIL